MLKIDHNKIFKTRNNKKAIKTVENLSRFRKTKYKLSKSS